MRRNLGNKYIFKESLYIKVPTVHSKPWNTLKKAVKEDTGYSWNNTKHHSGKYILGRQNRRSK